MIERYRPVLLPTNPRKEIESQSRLHSHAAPHTRSNNHLHRTQELTLEQTQLNWIANFIWGIADDVLRDLYVRGKYRDVEK
jgi:hypothetical protein